MGDCHLNYPNEEKFCKYSYASWCPTCERSSPRRRSRSETSECRRKCKDMKSICISPKKYNFEEQSYLKENFYRCRGLCELPTSYITNCNSKLPEYVTPLKMKQEEFFDAFKDNHLNFNTSTYFDNEKYQSELDAIKKNGKRLELEVRGRDVLKGAHSRLHEKYARDLEMVREKMRRIRSEQEDAITIGQSEIAPRPKKLAIKTKKVNIGKMGRVRLPSAKLRSGEPPQIESSGSDSEPETSEETHDDESESVSEATNGESETSIPNCAAGDAAGWPLRASLFPHVPPYIRFNSHNSEQPVVIPAGRRLFKWKLSTITPVVVRKTLTNSGFSLVRKSNQWLGTWGKHMKSPMFKTLKDTQKLNHFPGTFQLGRKDRLWRNFQRFINKFGYREFGFIPHTYILPQELKILKQNWEYKNGGSEAWIIKPPASARGVGIKVINRWSQLPKKTSLVVQKYIANPYLINGSKFDLRLYVLVTSFNPLRIYLYPDGLARFASAKYSDDAKDLKDRYVHLTNYSINKLSSQYTANEDANACQGHKWTITKLLEYMSKQGIDTKLLWKHLQSLVIKTIITAEAPIHQLCEENMTSRYNCYELFGIDVLLDENLKPWLLEVNISPSLHSSSPLDEHVKGPLVQMLFDLAQFHFPPRLAHFGKETPQCYQSKLYSAALTKKEREKHRLFQQYEGRQDYLEDILSELTGDDVRRLVQAEDELTVKGKFERIFPTAQTYKYLNFMEVRYYNRLFDAWEAKFEKNRTMGISLLRARCAEKVHLKVASESTIQKNLPSTTPGCASLLPSQEGQSHPLIESLQQVTIENNPSC